MTRLSELTGELYDTRLAAYCLVESAGKFLLTLWDMRHRDSKFMPRWCLPGGGIELGEGLEEGAVREVYEETGYHVKNLVLLDASTGVIPAAKRYTSTQHAMQTVAIVYRASIAGGRCVTRSAAAPARPPGLPAMRSPSCRASSGWTRCSGSSRATAGHAMHASVA